MSNSFLPTLADDPPIEGDAVVILDELVRRAIRFGASDIHLEPKRDHMQVRFRIDGAMTEQGVITADVAPQVSSRIKVLSRMDISERRMPQDGQFTLEPGPARVHLRASTFPASQGEKLVLRILIGHSLIPFDRIGMSTSMRARVRELVVQATRISWSLQVLPARARHRRSTRFCSSSTPPPSTWSHSKIRSRSSCTPSPRGRPTFAPGFTFAAGLRAILRQDPDVILVGEIRDAETAGIALQAPSPATW